jgi:uncharacterized protein
MKQENTLDILFPQITDCNKHFYNSIENGELVALKCHDCQHTFLPPSNYCPQCLSEKVDWIVLSGEGTVYSWVEYHHAFHKVLENHIPYVVAIVELKEGPRLISNIIHYNLMTLKVGTPLEAVFTKGFSNFPIVQFIQKN